ncbi:MAG: NADH-quinone oxidoreductase subunit N [Acidimicrobiales bacterium]|nr:NADH-quinone oxidoreductase subunit N [Acidimicrobiales bacterium]
MFAQLSTFDAPSVDWFALAPQIILVGAALLIMLITALSARPVPGWFSTGLTVIAGVASVIVAMVLWNDVRDEGAYSTVAGAIGVDGFSLFFTVLVSLGLIATALVGDSYLRREHMAAPEFHALLLSASTGAIVMASANDLVVMFIGLESLSIGLYVLAAMQFRRPQGREAAMKYFVLGAFSSAFLLYGIALVYGSTGSTNLVVVRDATSTLGNLISPNELLVVGIALLLVGFAFKIAAAPFHFWAPDVYEGSASPVSGFMASVAKAAAFAALLRVIVVAMGANDGDWAIPLAVLSAISIIVGAVMAISQNDVKRMLAFSSVGHAGYVLVGVQTATAEGMSSALFYLFVYTFMVIGSFAVVSVLGWDGGHPIERYEGLAKRRAWLAGAFTVFLLAQAGVPFTAGFVAKFLVIKSAVADEVYWLAVLAMVASVITAFMYLRIVMSMWMRDADVDGAPVLSISPATAFVLAATVAVTLVYGVVPDSLIEFARDAVPVLVAGG